MATLLIEGLTLWLKAVYWSGFIETAIDLYLGLHKRRLSYRRSLHPDSESGSGSRVIAVPIRTRNADCRPKNKNEKVFFNSVFQQYSNNNDKDYLHELQDDINLFPRIKNLSTYTNHYLLQRFNQISIKTFHSAARKFTRITRRHQSLSQNCNL